MYVIAVDLGGTQMRAAIVNEEGKLLTRKALKTNAKDGAERVIQRLIALLHEVADPFFQREGKSAFAGIGMAIPGALNVQEGIVHFSPNLPGWENVAIKEIMENEFSLPVYVANDADAAALGEYYFGQGKGVHNFIYVTISTGVGAGVIENGRLLLGVQGQAAEVGHMIVNPEGPKCSCGNFGCIEAYISGTGIVRRAKEELANSPLPSRLRQLEKIETKDVFLFAKEDDEIAQKIVEETKKYLGILTMNLIHLFNPKLIIFGGGVSQVGDELFAPAISYAKKKVMYPMGEQFTYRLTKLGDNVGLLGAASIVKYYREIT